MIKDIPVSRIMSNKVVVANLNNSISQVMELFTISRLHHLPVVEDDRIVGIISNNDLLKMFIEKFSGIDADTVDEQIKISDIMTSEPITVTSSTTIRHVAEILADKKFHALPVVDQGEIKGIVTSSDIVRYVIQL